MRLLLLALVLGLVATLVGCRLKNILPGKAVLSPAARAEFETAAAAAVDYTGPPRVRNMVPPFQVFGVQYAVDIVLVTRHPDWEMHEYARLDLPDGSVWVAKDSDRDGVQTITSSLPGLKGWLPEVPVRRISAPLEVEDRSEGRDIDITLRYTNPAGDPVEVWTRGRMPDKPPAKRNGNTMGHSRDIVAVVLDLERFGSRVRARMRIGERSWGFRRILGIVPYKFLLRQTQGGIAIASYRLEPIHHGWAFIRPGADAEDWPTQAGGTWRFDLDRLAHHSGVCSFVYQFEESGLSRVTVRQDGMDSETFSLWLQPALPDLRRPFEGVVTSRFRMDVGGQQGHGTGEVRASWIDADTVAVDIVPTAPHWLADRPMRSTIRYSDDGAVEVRTVRVETPE